MIEDSGFFKSSCEDLAEYLTQVAPATHFIFVEEEVDKRSKMYKTVKNNGKIVEFSAQSEELLTRWILTRLKKMKEKNHHRIRDAAFFEAGQERIWEILTGS